jgi:hypothetical protein
VVSSKKCEFIGHNEIMKFLLTIKKWDASHHPIGLSVDGVAELHAGLTGLSLIYTMYVLHVFG